MTEQFITINTEKNSVIQYEQYKLVSATDSILKTPTIPYDLKNPPTDTLYFAKSMFYTMFQNKGLGLSANQVGFPWSVFVVGYEDSNKQIFFNPRIVETSVEADIHDEGCLSYPGLYLKVKRPVWVKIAWEHIDGTPNERQFHGLTARVILHEYDHILGENYTQKIGKTSLRLAKEKLNKNKKRF